VPYDEMLAIRIRAALGQMPGMEEKKMFGGVAFLINGNMACGVIKNDLIVRVGPKKTAWALTQPHTRPFDFSGRLSQGWVVLAPQGCATESDLAAWLEQGLTFARSLPGK
jgi:hypothetical protein